MVVINALIPIHRHFYRFYSHVTVNGKKLQQHFRMGFFREIISFSMVSALKSEKIYKMSVISVMTLTFFVMSVIVMS